MKVILLLILFYILVIGFYCMPICDPTSTSTTEPCPHAHMVYSRILEKCINQTLPYYSYLSRGSGRVGFGGRPRHQSDKNKTKRKSSATRSSIELILLIVLLCISLL